MKLWCIHGNLQTPEVWTPFDGKFSSQGQPMKLETVNLWERTGVGFTEWTREFVKDAAECRAEDGQILMGYSLGGRLALHAYLKEPQLWKGAIIIAADTGSSDESLKQRQLEADQRWGKKFETGDLEQVLKEWDALPVFGEFPNTAPRNLNTLNSQKVAECFDHFSKGRQEDLLTALKQVNSPPLLYLSGQQDSKYTKIGQKLNAACPLVHHQTIPDACHRSPWENSDQFVEVVQQFIDSLSG